VSTPGLVPAPSWGEQDLGALASARHVAAEDPDRRASSGRLAGRPKLTRPPFRYVFWPAAPSSARTPGTSACPAGYQTIASTYPAAGVRDANPPLQITPLTARTDFHRFSVVRCWAHRNPHVRSACSPATVAARTPDVHVPWDPRPTNSDDPHRPIHLTSSPDQRTFSPNSCREMGARRSSACESQAQAPQAAYPGASTRACRSPTSRVMCEGFGRLLHSSKSAGPTIMVVRISTRSLEPPHHNSTSAWRQPVELAYQKQVPEYIAFLKDHGVRARRCPDGVIELRARRRSSIIERFAALHGSSRRSAARTAQRRRTGALVRTSRRARAGREASANPSSGTVASTGTGRVRPPDPGESSPNQSVPVMFGRPKSTSKSGS